MGTIAYELREEFAGTVEQVEHEGAEPVEVPVFSGGLIAAGETEDGKARDLNLRELLDEGDGTIVVEDHDTAAITALDQYPALKRVRVEPDAEPIVGAYNDRNTGDLRTELKRRGIEGAGNLSKDDAVAALERFDSFNPAPPAGTHVDRLGDTEVPGGFAQAS
jgi:hypothetical protein